jgi:hypothetical protein
MAYRDLAIVFYTTGETSRAADNGRKAYALRERTSEFEKLAISPYYFRYVTGNEEAAREACELWAQTYPHRDGPWLTLASELLK